MIAVRASGLSRHFGAVRALDGLDLEIPEGTIFGFLGPNGAGKTTTIRLLLGLLEPTAGSREVLGLDVAREPDGVRAAAGALLEHHGLYERLSAWNNLEFTGRIGGLPAATRAARNAELLERFGLAGWRDVHARKLSRGMKQKLAIARAIYHRPRLVFLDEPTNGLDPGSSVELRGELVALARRDGVTVFVTTHNLSEAERICDLVGIVNRGRLLALGSPEELRRRAGRPHVEISAGGLSDATVLLARRAAGVAAARLHEGRLHVELADGASPAPLVADLVRAGIAIEEVRRVTPSLEAAYLALMRDGEGEA